MGLCAFALRRALAPRLVVGLLLLLLLAARATETVSVVADDAQALAALRGLVRQNVWSVLFLAAPFLFLHAAELGRSEANAWLAPTASTPLARAGALLGGLTLAALAASTLTAAAGELAVEGGHATWRRIGLLQAPTVLLDGSTTRVRWPARVPRGATRLSLTVTVAIGSGPAVSARFRASPAGQAEALAVEARVAGRTALGLALPAGGNQDLELELERLGSGALLVLPPDALEALAPVPSERRGALALLAHAVLALTSGSALAFGFARALRPALAAGLAATLLLAGGGTFASGTLGAAWTQLGAALVPPGPSVPAWLTAAGALGLAASLHARQGRSA
jgi:hypothetical protein